MADPFIAESPDQIPSRDELLAMSGMDFMQGMLRGEISRPPISGLLNYALHSVEEGRVAFRGTPEFAHTNPMGSVHGGWYGTLLDSAMSCAVMTVTPKGSVYTTLEYKINIMGAGPLGRESEAVGILGHAGRSRGIATDELRDLETGRLYANGTATCIIMEMTRTS